MADPVESFTLPTELRQRLQTLLDREDQGEVLSPQERMEAEELVRLAERSFSPQPTSAEACQRPFPVSTSPVPDRFPPTRR